jgi:hypothetical protein
MKNSIIKNGTLEKRPVPIVLGLIQIKPFGAVPKMGLPKERLNISGQHPAAGSPALPIPNERLPPSWWAAS